MCRGGSVRGLQGRHMVPIDALVTVGNVEKEILLMVLLQHTQTQSDT